jgi:hypothetical protein
MRPRASRRTTVLQALIVVTMIAVLPASSATAGEHRQPAAVAPGCPPSGNIVYRPAYPGLRSKPLYLSGYAGAVYPPVRRRGPLEPTTTRRPFAGWFSGPASYP